jgi:hypothetical protein
MALTHDAQHAHAHPPQTDGALQRPAGDSLIIPGVEVRRKGRIEQDNQLAAIVLLYCHARIAPTAQPKRIKVCPMYQGSVRYGDGRANKRSRTWRITGAFASGS